MPKLQHIYLTERQLANLRALAQRHGEHSWREWLKGVATRGRCGCDAAAVEYRQKQKHYREKYKLDD